MEEDPPTYFSAVHHPFPDLKDSKINTKDFLAASNSVVTLVGKLLFTY